MADTTDREAVGAAGRDRLVEYLVENGVDRTYAEIFVKQQLQTFSRLENAQHEIDNGAFFQYGNRQYGPRHYDELGKLLLLACGRGKQRRALDDAPASAAEKAQMEMRSRVAGAF